MHFSLHKAKNEGLQIGPRKQILVSLTGTISRLTKITKNHGFTFGVR